MEEELVTTNTEEFGFNMFFGKFISSFYFFESIFHFLNPK